MTECFFFCDWNYLDTQTVIILEEKINHLNNQDLILYVWEIIWLSISVYAKVALWCIMVFSIYIWYHGGAKVKYRNDRDRDREVMQD